MNAKVSNILKAIQADVTTLAQLVFDSDSISNNTKVNKNTLKDSQLAKDVEVRVLETGNPIIEVLFNHYIVYLEWNRPPKHKKKPPISVLKDWAVKNGIPDDNETLWKISYAIWRDGHQARPITATLIKEVEDKFDKEYFDMIFEALIDDLLNFFTD
ncbi:hypothetical protein [Dysgonomonas sp. 520]|uniref:hypothetical protein n=1 Tax=Dysgonomonas sp. 520 TaxID=2302931 RepID=UPI0013CFD508|nr:hypothetical protein [Dysgonomonas sp. 520]NDW09837.1 hypothetical protein [Dysgonomonas sp. 520]